MGSAAPKLLQDFVLPGFLPIGVIAPF